MILRRVMIAASKSGSGKTTITCSLLQALKDRGHHVVSYKCGPDYIDPMFHKTVLGIPSKNLDTFFTGEEKTKELFLKDRKENDFAVIEGVMGLFDGLGGIREEGSSYHLAKVTQTPIILVVDANGMGRSVISLIAGFLAYDTEHLIKGVILNRMSKAYYEMIKPLIEAELHICALGFFPNNSALHMESRHLGLMMPDEISGVKEQLQEAAGTFAETVSVEGIIQIAENAGALIDDGMERLEAANNSEKTEEAPIIAVARDEAFCFYYEDNLRLLEECGAKLQFFSPIYDSKLPEGSNALLLGGGYPELYAQKLSNNKAMLSAIKSAFNKGIPTVAECGGFMYLHSAIIDKEGNVFEMAGVIPNTCCDKGKLVRFGYIELEEKHNSFLPQGEKIKGHEFHYFDSENNGDDCLVLKPVTQKKYSCVISGENYWLGFPHLYYPSNLVFACNFVEKARKYKKED